MKDFKVGDLVYMPSMTTSIVQLDIYEHDTKYPLFICDINEKVNIHGLLSSDNKNQSIFHATEENRQLLNKLYSTEFEKPPCGELTKRLLANGWDSVPCMVSDVDEQDAKNNRIFLFINTYTVFNKNHWFGDTEGGSWKFAVPFDPRTGKELTDNVFP